MLISAMQQDGAVVLLVQGRAVSKRVPGRTAQRIGTSPAEALDTTNDFAPRKAP